MDQHALARGQPAAHDERIVRRAVRHRHGRALGQAPRGGDGPVTLRGGVYLQTSVGSAVFEWPCPLCLLPVPMNDACDDLSVFVSGCTRAATPLVVCDGCCQCMLWPSGCEQADLVKCKHDARHAARQRADVAHRHQSQKKTHSTVSCRVTMAQPWESSPHLGRKRAQAGPHDALPCRRDLLHAQAHIRAGACMSHTTWHPGIEHGGWCQEAYWASGLGTVTVSASPSGGCASKKEKNANQADSRTRPENSNPRAPLLASASRCSLPVASMMSL